MAMGLGRRRLHLAVCTVGVLLLGAAAPVVAQTDAPPTSPPPPSVPPPPVPVLRFPIPQDDGTLTPYTFELAYPLVTLVYDTLLWRDAKGVPQPWLARSVERSLDGREVTVRLVDNARWHDGRPVTSGDVVFTFEFVASHPHSRFTPELRAVQRVRAVGPTTVVISLRHPSAGFSDQPLADLPILPAHLWRGLPRDQLAPPGLPVGSGPYRLVDHQPGQRYRFEANAEYFRGPPAVTTIEAPILRSAEETFQALESHTADMIPLNLSERGSERLESLGIRVVRGTSYRGTSLLLNTRQAPFDRPEVRRALAAAIDLRRVARTVGDAVPADRGYVHPQSPWATAEPIRTFDAAAAKQGLAQAGIANLEVITPEADPTRREAGRQVVLALERAGVKAELKPLPRAEVQKALGAEGAPATFQAAIVPIPSLASYDPGFLVALFNSDPAVGSVNYSSYRSPAFDALSERIETTLDPAARRAAVEEALRLLATDVPALPLFFAEGAFSYRPVVYDGWVFVDGSGILDKRSFLERAPPRESTTAPTGIEPAEDDEALPLALLAVGLLVLGLLVGAVAILWGRRG